MLNTYQKVENSKPQVGSQHGRVAQPAAARAPPAREFGRRPRETDSVGAHQDILLISAHLSLDMNTRINLKIGNEPEGVRVGGKIKVSVRLLFRFALDSMSDSPSNCKVL